MVNLIPTKFGMKIQLATAKIVGGLMWFFQNPTWTQTKTQILAADV